MASSWSFSSCAALRFCSSSSKIRHRALTVVLVLVVHLHAFHEAFHDNFFLLGGYFGVDARVVVGLLLRVKHHYFFGVIELGHPTSVLLLVLSIGVVGHYYLN